MDTAFLTNALIYLAAAVVAVPLAKRLGLGSVIGYLGAGLVIGPWGLRLISDVEAILHFSEFGVVLLLFLIGLELDPKRLWQMRGPIFGLGGAQVLGCGLLLAALALAMGWKPAAAAVAGMGLALSSTAIALQPLTERNLLTTAGGRAAFSTLLFQDIAVIPMLALLPLLAGQEDLANSGEAWRAVLLAVGVIGAVVAGGRYLTRPLFRYIAATGMREIFTAAALLIVIGSAALMQMAGLSMALGTFMAGVLLAESEFRHELESDIEPFKGLLLGLFFISVGMSVDIGLLIQWPGTVVGLVAALLLLKAAVLGALARFGGVPRRQAALFIFLLAPGGEFAFVIFGAAAGSGALDAQTAGLLTVAVALSMLAGPLLLVLHDRLIAPRLSRVAERPQDQIEDEGHKVIIAGFGRFGQIITRLLHSNGISATVLDHDPDNIETLRRFGFKVFYGDATRQDLLEAAGADKAKLLVVVVDDETASLELVDMARRRFPHLKIIARARNVQHVIELLNREIPLESVQRETFLAALALGEQALRALGHGAYAAHRRALTFRRANEALLRDMYAHWDEGLERRISLQKAARAQLEQNLAADEKAITERRDHGWD